MEQDVQETAHTFAKKISAKERRKLRAQKRRDRGVLRGLGLFGLVGWSVALPTLLALAAGIWIDRHLAGRYSWTLMLLVVGIALGCLNAWYWIKQESKEQE